VAEMLAEQSSYVVVAGAEQGREKEGCMHAWERRKSEEMLLFACCFK